MDIVLASQSPRRAELMKLITPDFTVCASEIDESKILADTPTKLVQALAKQKCEKTVEKFSADCVIGCDTVVNLGGRVLGKPKNAAQAREMLDLLSGVKHCVHTGVYIRTPFDSDEFVTTTEVWFSPLTDEEIESYLKTDEPYDKAGGYGIQGWAARHISRIEGCYYNVMGLPVSALYSHLKALCVI